MEFPRQLSKTFFNDLESGLLVDIIKRIKSDDTLLLALRGKYINIYYRGGSLLKIEANETANNYRAFFDVEYNKSELPLPKVPYFLNNASDVITWIEAFPKLKEIMDFFFASRSKLEREFQQLVARENNCSSISNETEYFITDIEFAEAGLGARFDILALRWLANERKNGSKCRVALIEMKYGDSALSGNSGLINHLQDMETFLKDSVKYQSLLGTMSAQFNQLAKLDMINFNRSNNVTNIELSADGNKPEVIFLLANHNPRSSKLEAILNDQNLDQYAHSPYFDLRFFVASFAGYGIHSDCLLNLDKFRQLIKMQLAAKKAIEAQ
jgi:hypothetical protein